MTDSPSKTTKTNEDDQGQVKPYTGPAGGWGSVMAGIGHMLKQGKPLGTASALLRVNQPDGFYLGNPARERDWKTATGKANFTVATIPDMSLPAGQLRLMTLRSHDQYNTTVYSENDRYRGVSGTRRIIFMHRQDLVDRGLIDGQHVDIHSHFPDGIERCVTGFRATTYDIPRGCSAGYFPELNPLVSVNATADGSHTPTSKFIPITVAAAP